jgi:Ca-activated chloride channel homolog
MTDLLTLAQHPERRLIRPTGSYRHVDFAIRASARPARTDDRPALALDRSGSMHGDKISTAREAAATVVDALDERDSVAVVVFDDRTDARGSTALHEGWLTGCREVADEPSSAAAPARLARCLLLTDGLANIGLTDAEQIAAQAAGIRQSAGVGTSTFGIGLDYAEQLLGPMAVAGEGQFHHLRTSADMRQTFRGELVEIFAVAASNVRLELRTSPDVSIDVVSQYRVAGEAGHAVIGVGDLMGGEERHIVVRFGFPPQTPLFRPRVESRISWQVDGAARLGVGER